MSRTLDEFKEAHDPTYKILAPTTVYSRELAAGAKRYLITAAQNATPVHKAWWRVLRTMTKKLGAELLVIPMRYKNPTSQWSGSQQNAEHWATEVRPFLWNVRHALNQNLTVLADLKIQPTAASPLSGAEAVSLESSGIIGHTKLQLRSIPTAPGRMAKLLTTSGACTEANYTDSRAGRIGEFHHSLSAILVEVDGKRFYMRPVHFDAKTKSCTDLETRYTEKGSGRAPRPLALSMGDTHVDAICPVVEQATFGDGGIVDTLNPQYLIWHDLLDSYSVNPHHDGNPFNAVAKRQSGTDDARAEVQRAIEFVAKRTTKDIKSVVVGSNHNDMLRRWIVSNDWRRDPVNAEFYLETALAMVRGTKMTGKGTEYPDPFAYWFRQAVVPNSRVLDVDESFMLGGVELGMHGDQGPNGARGSIHNLRRIGVKSILGHSHAAGIDEGAYQAGTSTRLQLEYNHGASSWLNAHVLLHADGKRQHIFIVSGSWRG
ncbi:MAG: hypothetical protein A3E01_08355 [Gammaproteobacteria bacterium RIFCSPHIGHO2_12_FULL_63_22]|nr:MAG: hypothetical protein A3E01_08355 [Gammaproteobacteria bacterium RIFCSPHIGHO2_12_FULL_63_22]